MKKLLICLLACLCVICPVLAESTPENTPVPTMAIQLVSPTPTAQPTGETFSSEDLIVTLPAGMHILSEDELSGYIAAAQSDFPDAGQTLIVAANDEFTAIISFSISDIALDGTSAACEAAETILGSSAGIMESQFGENKFGIFACSIEDQVYRLYCLAGESRLLAVGATGLDEPQLSAMLASIVF